MTFSKVMLTFNYRRFKKLQQVALNHLVFFQHHGLIFPFHGNIDSANAGQRGEVSANTYLVLITYRSVPTVSWWLNQTLYPIGSFPQVGVNKPC